VLPRGMPISDERERREKERVQGRERGTHESFSGGRGAGNERVETRPQPHTMAEGDRESALCREVQEMAYDRLISIL